jgi:hypothetical protein
VVDTQALLVASADALSDPTLAAEQRSRGEALKLILRSKRTLDEQRDEALDSLQDLRERLAALLPAP